MQAVAGQPRNEWVWALASACMSPAFHWPRKACDSNMFLHASEAGNDNRSAKVKRIGQAGEWKFELWE